MAKVGELCPSCQCCEMVFSECYDCGGDGWVESDDWQDFGELMRCGTCQGETGWPICLGDCCNGKHEESHG